MKATAVLNLIWIAYALAQGRSQEDCQATCFQAVIDSPPYDLGCSNGNQTCLCSHGNFKNAVRDCAYATCRRDVVPHVVSTAERFCTDCKSVCLDSIVNSPPQDLICSSGDTACLCKAENFKHAVRDCAYAACPHNIAHTLVKEVESICAATVTSTSSFRNVSHSLNPASSTFSVPFNAPVVSSRLVPEFYPTPTGYEQELSKGIQTSASPLPSGMHGSMGIFRDLNVSSVTFQVSPSGKVRLSGQNATQKSTCGNMP
ncbi:hypothetical protein BDV34DRAFT_229543 [Aspergillus parasiticus]|uniref:CFEM domain-containing protein n=1 Tax=Aspergillus parasiticus TaxID=5067 RepID=A0A5N6D7H5_ASPPA|nr:hypothetical protein BDV34DRAFT_229543 [Aspergillus parasiticus]